MPKSPAWAHYRLPVVSESLRADCQCGTVTTTRMRLKVG